MPFHCRLSAPFPLGRDGLLHLQSPSLRQPEKRSTADQPLPDAVRWKRHRTVAEKIDDHRHVLHAGLGRVRLPVGDGRVVHAELRSHRRCSSFSVSRLRLMWSPAVSNFSGSRVRLVRWCSSGRTAAARSLGSANRYVTVIWFCSTPRARPYRPGRSQQRLDDPALQLVRERLVQPLLQRGEQRLSHLWTRLDRWPLLYCYLGAAVKTQARPSGRPPIPSGPWLARPCRDRCAPSGR